MCDRDTIVDMVNVYTRNEVLQKDDHINDKEFTLLQFYNAVTACTTNKRSIRTRVVWGGLIADKMKPVNGAVPFIPYNKESDEDRIIIARLVCAFASKEGFNYPTLETVLTVTEKISTIKEPLGLVRADLLYSKIEKIFNELDCWETLDVV